MPKTARSQTYAISENACLEVLTRMGLLKREVTRTDLDESIGKTKRTAFRGESHRDDSGEYAGVE